MAAGLSLHLERSPGLLEAARAVVRAQRRAAADSGAWSRFRRVLGPEQLALVDDERPLVAADPGRRAGKTTAFLGKTQQVFDRHPRAAVAYFAPSDEQGVDIVWEDIREHNRTYDLGMSEHWSERWWTRGARRLEVIGFNSRKDAERARGRKFHLAWLDEAQLAPDWFARIVREAIMPTTLDFLGQVIASGTPGEVAEGFFFEACHGSEWSNAHHWTCADNPFFAGRDPLREARERFNLAIDSITYRREWLGLWIVDPDALVYYIPDPAVRAWSAPGTFSDVLGLDFGWKDKDALSHVSVDPLRQYSHLRAVVEMDGKQTNHKLFERIMEFQSRLSKPAPVVFDPAGHTTNKTIETFRADAPKIMWVAADKRRKVEYIDLLNNDLRSGATFVEPGSPMLKEARRLRWKRPGKVAEDADHTDMGDAWLYAWRYARDSLRALAPEKVKRDPHADPFDEVMASRLDQGGNYFENQRRRLTR